MSPHKAVHENVINSINYFKSEDTRLENEEKIIHNMKSMEENSGQLFVLLNDMLGEYHK